MDRIDSDADGLISTAELKAWIKRVQKRYTYENVAKVWADYDLDKDNKITWEEYKQATYGYYLCTLLFPPRCSHEHLITVSPLSENGLMSVQFLPPANPEEFEEATDQFNFKKMLPRDERRFKRADLNRDLAADREEFTSFLHPEEFEHMKDIVVEVSKDI